MKELVEQERASAAVFASVDLECGFVVAQTYAELGESCSRLAVFWASDDQSLLT